MKAQDTVEVGIKIKATSVGPGSNGIEYSLSDGLGQTVHTNVPGLCGLAQMAWGWYSSPVIYNSFPVDEVLYATATATSEGVFCCPTWMEKVGELPSCIGFHAYLPGNQFPTCFDKAKQVFFNYMFTHNEEAMPVAIWDFKENSGTQLKQKSEIGHYNIYFEDEATAKIVNTTDPVTFTMTKDGGTGSTFSNSGGRWTLIAGTNEGTVEIKAEITTTNSTICLLKKFTFDVKDCATCNDSSCKAYAGLNSVDIKIPLGASIVGGSAGFLQVKQDYPSPELGTPATLMYNFIRPDVVKVTNEVGHLVQVRAPEVLACIVTNTASSYSVNLYSWTNIGDFTDGQFAFSGDPFRTVTIENVDGDTNHVKLSDSGKSTTDDYHWEGNGWLLESAGGLRRVSHAESTEDDLRIETYDVKDPWDTVVHHSSKIWQTFSFGEKLVEEVDGTGDSARTNSYFYETNGLISEIHHADGSWEIFRMDDQRRQTHRFSPFLNSAPTTNTAECRLTESIYSTNVVSGSGDDGSLEPFAPRCVIESVLGEEISRRYTVILPGERHDIQCPQPGMAWDDTNNIVTKTYYYDNVAHAGDIHHIENPDGTVQFTWHNPALENGFRWTRTSTGIGSSDWNGGTPAAGTQTDTKYDWRDFPVIRYVTEQPSGKISSYEEMKYDHLGRLTNITYLDHTKVIQTYDCCHLTSRTERDGSVTTYTYDDLDRLLTTTQNGITMRNVYNANGDIESTVRIGTNGTEIVMSTTTYDASARQTATQDALGHMTTYTNWMDGNGQTISLTTYPNTDRTLITTNARDGFLLGESGTSIYPRRYEQGVESDGGYYRLYTKEIKLLTNGVDSGEWTKSYQDALGRNYKTVSSGGATNLSFFNNKGQLEKQIDPDGVVTLFGYNDLGEVEYQAIDTNRNDTIDLNLDRVTRTVRDVTMQGTNTVRRTRTYVYAANGSSQATLISTSLQSTEGMQSWSIASGVTNHMMTQYLGNGARRTTQTSSDGTISVQVFTNGQTVSTVVSNSLGVLRNETMIYDEFGRLLTTTDARNGTTTFAYNEADQITNSITPVPGTGLSAQTNVTVYDESGQVERMQHGDGTWTTNEYFLTGALKKTYGSRTYPVEYTYDYAGRMQTMKTWTNFAGNSGAAVTTWLYDGTRGFMTNKLYADSQGPSYTYTPAGRLSSRTWARGVVTTNTYNDVGDLAAVNYSDATPDVTYSYDRLGRAVRIVGGSTNTLSYNAFGQLFSEDVMAAGYGYASQSRQGYDILQRLSGYTNVTAGVAWQFGYAGSLLTNIANGAQSVGYSYLANSTLPGDTVFRTNGAVKMTTSRQYDYLNRLRQIASTPEGLSSVASFDYAYNDANQRTAVTNVDASRWNYAYDSLGQVTNGTRRWSNGDLVAGQQFDFSFDDIGNRILTRFGGDTNGADLRSGAYTANHLNQYTTRTVPGYVTAAGLATNTSTVTVNGSATDRQGEYFWTELVVDNSSSNVVLLVTNEAVVGSVTSLVVRTAMVPTNSEAFTYDADGNLLRDGLRQYTWDAENRLIAVEVLTNAFSTNYWQKVESAYDPQGRRIVKQVSRWNGSGYQPVSKRKFLYWGWNLVAEMDEITGLRVSYTWGLDLSGSMQGAGGVGGLLRIKVHTGILAGDYLCAYDGNGNLTALVKQSDGSTVANYEYSPFGELLRASGTLAKLNPFRFCTKYTDDETDLVYYGYRYYNTSRGRWLSRDPIEENGGVNLYGFCKNDAVNLTDAIGFYPGLPGHGFATSPINSVSLIARIQNSADLDEDYLLHELRYPSDPTIPSLGGRGLQAFSLDRNQRRLNHIIPKRPSDNPGGINTDGGNFFVYTCRYGWIDMGHFFRNANATYAFGARTTALFAWINEDLQQWVESDSAWAVEDLVSNEQGRNFGDLLKAKDKQSIARAVSQQRFPDALPASAFTSIVKEWTQFLRNAGAVNWTSISTRLIENDLANYQRNTPPFARTSSDGLRWQKKQQLWKCLCNGNKPKLPQHQF